MSMETGNEHGDWKWAWRLEMGMETGNEHGDWK